MRRLRRMSRSEPLVPVPPAPRPCPSAAQPPGPHPGRGRVSSLPTARPRGSQGPSDPLRGERPGRCHLGPTGMSCEALGPGPADGEICGPVRTYAEPI